MSNATANDIIQKKTAYVDGVKITGTMQKQFGDLVIPSTKKKVVCPANRYLSSNIAVKGDANLKPENIKRGVSIFGVEGSAGIDPSIGRMPEDACLIQLEVSNPAGCNVYGGGVVSKGLTVTVWAEPQNRYKITNFAWKEGGKTVSNNMEYTFVVDGHKTLVADFNAVKEYKITTSVDPRGSGTTTGDGLYEEGKSVTVTAVSSNEERFQFINWQELENNVSNKASYSFNPTQNRNLTARFEKLPYFEWETHEMPSTANWYSVTYGNGKFVAVANNSNKTAYSTDGITWTAATLPSSANWGSVTYGNGKFVAVAYNSDKVITGTLI